MERHEDASKCISYLNNTDMDGDTITVEWVNIRPFLWSILHFRGAYLVLLAYHFGITCQARSDPTLKIQVARGDQGSSGLNYDGNESIKDESSSTSGRSRKKSILLRIEL